MSTVVEVSFRYSKLGHFNAIKYKFRAEITDPRILGIFIGSVIKAVEKHLTNNRKWDYQLGLSLTTDTISIFGVNIQKRLNWEVIHSRLLAYTESKRNIFGESNFITINITALMLDPGYDKKRLEARLRRSIETKTTKNQKPKLAKRLKARPVKR